MCSKNGSLQVSKCIKFFLVFGTEMCVCITEHSMNIER